MSKISVFSLLENILEEEIPKCVVYILTESGFNSKMALKGIGLESIAQIEKYFNSNYEKLRGGLSGSLYENMEQFKILPGHRVLIESIPQYVDQLKITNQSSTLNRNTFSYVLNLLIETAENNSDRDPKGRRYDELLRYFATYLYLMSGRAFYETLSANIPIPQANTICKY